MHYEVFSDMHHLSLFNSLSILFDQRLKGSLYRPIGKEWFEQGFWKMSNIYNDAPSTIEQYLGINPGYQPPDGSKPLNRVKKIEDDIYYIYDPEYLYHHKAITLKKFLATKIDFVIASIPQHIESFRRLCDLHPNKPKLIFQIGNAWELTVELTKKLDAIMSSAKTGTGRRQGWVPYIEYHQEFDLKIFSPMTHVLPPNNIYSFINCFNLAEHYRSDWEQFLEVEKLMPGWNFKSFGGSCRDGVANGAIDLANKMHDARFIWHVKKFGDGYGHVLHNSAAVARPVIIKKSDYENKLGGDLLIDGETCINIDNLSSGQIVEKINYWNESARYSLLCENTYANFKKVVDFDREFENIKLFLQKLL